MTSWDFSYQIWYPNRFGWSNNAPVSNWWEEVASSSSADVFSASDNVFFVVEGFFFGDTLTEKRKFSAFSQVDERQNDFLIFVCDSQTESMSSNKVV